MLGRSNVLCNRYGVGDLESDITVVVTYPSGSICTCTDGTRLLRAVDKIGTCIFYIPNYGEWSISCYDPNDSSGYIETKNIAVDEYGPKNIALIFSITRKYLSDMSTNYKVTTDTVYSNSFRARNKLKTVDLTASAPITIMDSAFYGSVNLQSVVIRSTSVSILNNTNAFNVTPIEFPGDNEGGCIFVPRALLNQYKSATNWSTYSRRFVPLEEYPTNDYSSIRDTWEQIFANEANGTYSTKYVIGDTKALLYDGVLYYVRLVGIDVDDLADGTGKAKLTWIFNNVLYETRQMNTSGTVAGGWPNMALRSYVRSTCYNNLPEIIRSNIKEVSKTSQITGGSTVTSTETVWIPSVHEMTSSTNTSETGANYYGYFTNNGRRRRYDLNHKNTESGQMYWLRSGTSGSSTTFYYIIATGANASTLSVTRSDCGILLGFCT